MLTDWLIYLDLLEENNYNTSFLRFVTPIIFGIYNCNKNFYYINYGDSFYGEGNGNGFNDEEYNDLDNHIYLYGCGYGFNDGNGCGNLEEGISYIALCDEEH